MTCSVSCSCVTEEHPGRAKCGDTVGLTLYQVLSCIHYWNVTAHHTAQNLDSPDVYAQIEIREHWLIFHDVQNILRFVSLLCDMFLSLWSCYWKYWKGWAEVPLRVLVDSGRDCDQRFLHGLEYNGSYSDTTAAYSPHQNRMAGT